MEVPSDLDEPHNSTTMESIERGYLETVDRVSRAVLDSLQLSRLSVRDGDLIICKVPQWATVLAGVRPKEYQQIVARLQDDLQVVAPGARLHIIDKSWEIFVYRAEAIGSISLPQNESDADLVE